MKFTFKTTKVTGQFHSFFNDTHDIKLNKVKVGSIEDKTWKIRLKVIKTDINEDGNPNCDWKWVTLKKESKSLQEAKDWLNENINIITNKYPLVKTN